MDDYEVIPHKVLKDLKGEIEQLKDKLSEPETPTDQIVSSMDDLKKSITSLQQLFATAIEYMKSDEEGFAIGKSLQKLSDRLDAIEAQNKQIAKGIVTVADMLEEEMDNRKMSKPLQKPAAPIPSPFSEPAPLRAPPASPPPSMGPPGLPPLGAPPGNSAPPPLGAPAAPTALGVPPPKPKGKEGIFDKLFTK